MARRRRGPATSLWFPVAVALTVTVLSYSTLALITGDAVGGWPFGLAALVLAVLAVFASMA